MSQKTILLILLSLFVSTNLVVTAQAEDTSDMSQYESVDLSSSDSSTADDYEDTTQEDAPTEDNEEDIY